MTLSYDYQNGLDVLNKCLGEDFDIVLRHEEDKHTCLSNTLKGVRCRHKLAKRRTQSQYLKEREAIFGNLRELNLNDDPVQYCEQLEKLARLSFCGVIHMKKTANFVSVMSLFSVEQRA